MVKVTDVYNIIPRYENLKTEFLNRPTVKINGKITPLNKNNLKYAQEWLQYKENRLQRENGVSDIAKIRNAKTLYKEILMLENVIYWFNGFDLKKISDQELIKVIDDIERSNLKSRTGKPLSDTVKKDYYTKVFRGDNTFFGYLKLNDRAKDIIIRKFVEPEEVRFFSYDTFKIIVNNAKLLSHKVCFSLLYDTGIEVSAIVQLTKSDFFKEVNKEAKLDYYKIRVPKDISKKTREKRYINVIDSETNKLLETYLENFKDDERIFDFNPPAIYKALKLIVRQHKLKTIGDTSKEITIKDFRSSCATRMFNLGFNGYQVNARLGHNLSSRTIDRYISYLGIDMQKQTKEIQNFNLNELMDKYNELLTINKKQQQEINEIKENWRKLTTYTLTQEFILEMFYDEMGKIKDKELPPKIKKALEKLGYTGKERYFDYNEILPDLEEIPLFKEAKNG